MGWPFRQKRRKAQQAFREKSQADRMAESQFALLEAVKDATTAAEDVTQILRSELDDSLRQIELTAGIMNDGLLVCAENGSIITMNPAAERLFLQSLAQRSVHISTLLQTKPETGSFWSDMAKAKSLHAVRADGQTFEVTANVARLDRSDGTVTYLVIVRQKNAAEGQGINHLLQVGLEGVLIVTEQSIVASNPAIGTLLGYTRDEFANLDLNQVVAGGELGLFRNSSEVDFIDAQFDSVLLCKDGSTIPARITLTHIEWAGSHVCVVTMDREKPSTPLEESNDIIRCFSQDYSLRSVRMMRQHMPMVCHLDSDLNVTYANRAFCAAYGLEPDSARGIPLSNVLPSAEFESACLHFKSLRENAPERALNIQFRKGSSIVYQEWVDNVVHDEFGNIVEYIRTGRVSTHQR